MIYIKRNNAHLSQIFVSEEIDDRGKPLAIYKSSSTETGISDLKKELAGINWYNQYSPKPIASIPDLGTPLWTSKFCTAVARRIERSML